MLIRNPDSALLTPVYAFQVVPSLILTSKIDSLSRNTRRNMYYMLIFHPNNKSWLRPPLKSCIRLSGCSSNRFSHYLQYFLSTGVRNVHICIRIVVQKAYCAHTYCVRKSREGAKNRHSGATKKSFLTNFRTFAHLELDIC